MFDTLAEVVDGAEDEVGMPPGLGSIVPWVGVEGKVHQTCWKPGPSRLNHQMITGNVTLQYQEKSELISLTWMKLSWRSSLPPLLILAKEIEPYASGSMEMKYDALAMPALAKRALKGVVMPVEASVDGGSARRRMLRKCSRELASLWVVIGVMVMEEEDDIPVEILLKKVEERLTLLLGKQCSYEEGLWIIQCSADLLDQEWIKRLIQR
jgi:hypothetical protein